MAKEAKRKQLHYRRASFLSPLALTLEELVESALARLNRVGDRFEKIAPESPDEDWRRFVNTHRSALGMQFGNLVLYASNLNRHTLAIDENADELDVEQIAPPVKADGLRREFLESILYYGIKGNHVVLLQSSSLKARELELHLNWLLKRVGGLDTDNYVFLNNYAPKVTSEKLENAPVKSVRVGTPLYDKLDEVPEKAGLSVKRTRFRPSGDGLSILNLLAPNRLVDLSLEELSESSNLEVFVEVTYKYQTDEGSQKLLNKLTQALRHVDEDDIRIELKGAGTIVGPELQIKSFKSIATYGGLVDPEDLFSKMHEWLLDNLEMGLVDPE